jgi:hypothetical protein
MPRITCDQPGNKPLGVRGINLGTAPVTAAEAPDFSVPDPNDASTRITVAGEIWWGSPIYLVNKGVVTRTVTVSVLAEGGATTRLGVVMIPAGETVAFPVQGQSLLKRSAGTTFGDRLRLVADAGNDIDYWAAAYERRADDHIGVVA